MNQVLAPWRMECLRGKGKGRDGCVCCQCAAQPDEDAAQLVAARSEHVFAVLNRYPYTYGHVMIIPYAHIASCEATSAAGLADQMTMANRVMQALPDTLANVCHALRGVMQRLDA